MDPRMRDYMMNRNRNSMRRDERNPYGSRGGYVSSGRPDHNYDSRSYYSGEFQGMSDGNRGYGDRYGRDFNDYRNRREDSHPYPMSPYPMYDDYDHGGGYLSKEELYRWKNKLYNEMEKGECEMLSDEKVLKRAKEMGIRFENFTEDEFIVTVLMIFTDYCKTLGKANIDMYIKMAKDFLDDSDAGVKYGEKLTAYYDNIVNV